MIGSPPISPTETQQWSRCPMLWYLTHVERWAPPPAAWTPERLIGSSLAKGLAVWWSRRVDEAEGMLREEFTRGWVEGTAFGREALEAHTVKVFKAVVTWCEGNMAVAEPVLVEAYLGRGYGVPDLVTREVGQLVVTDWKYSHILPVEKMSYRLEGVHRDHQFLHYAWAVGEKMGEPVAAVRKVVIAGTPRIKVASVEVSVNTDMLTTWERSARLKWGEMGRMRAYPELVYRREEGCRPFGEKWPCPMMEACWTCHGDRDQMRQFYIQEVRDGG